MASRGGASALVVALCLLLRLAPSPGAAEPLVPAMFVFGDSTLDVGNNNYLKNCTVDCKANYPRYGVDYRDQAPTGRFSNGYNLADHLAQQLGFAESPPPFLSLPEESRVPQMMSTGINFASGGSGILYSTGKNHCIEVLSMSEQVGKFSRLARSANQTIADLISRSLFFISVGSNDFFEYVGPGDRSRNDTEFLQLLVSSYSRSLKGLYATGARKFSVVSPSLVGCVPSQRLIANQTEEWDELRCFAPANNLSITFYPMVASMLDGLSTQLSGLNYSLGDSISMVKLVLNGTQTPGNSFRVLDTACCGTGDFGADACNASATLCPDRGSYLFWDRFHPSDNASRLTATTLFSGPELLVHPVNVSQLVASHRP